MNLIFAGELASQRINDMHQAAACARLARQMQLTQPSRKRDSAVPDTCPAPDRSRARTRWTRSRTAVRQWIDRTHLGPVDNYVTR